jgi:hypothetical protein
MSTDVTFDTKVIDVYIHPKRKRHPFRQGETKKKEVTSEAIAIAAFTHFLAPNGLPRLSIMDARRTLSCNVRRKSKDQILCKRFHRHLNKVERIHAAQISSLSASGESPIDGTAIVGPCAAKGRTLDIRLEPNVPRLRTSSTGDASLQHVESVFPNLQQQQRQ